jgi:hypothetical protein
MIFACLADASQTGLRIFDLGFVYFLIVDLPKD